MPTAASQIADGVWRITRGVPLRINVFFVREGDGVAVFDSGHKPMGAAVRAAADALGGATRVVLGNPHADHRGGAPAVGAPIHCHADDRENVEGDGAAHDFDFGKLPFFAARARRGRRSPPGTAARCRSPRRSPRATASATSRSSTCPATRRAASACGAPRTASRSRTTASRCFIRRCPLPGRRRAIPHSAFNWSDERCAASIAKLAALEPATCWPAHYGPLTGDVAAKLRAAI